MNDGVPESDDLPTLDDYLREQAPELANPAPTVGSNQNKGARTESERALNSQVRRPRTRQYTGTSRRRNQYIYNDDFTFDWDDASLMMGLKMDKDEWNIFQKAFFSGERYWLNKGDIFEEPDHLFLMAALENDTPRYHEAMNGSYSKQYYDAMEKEMDTLEVMDAWDVVPRSEVGNSTVLDDT